MQLAHFDIDHFLSHHWQKRPLLIRNPWAQWRNPIDPDELAGLACEPLVESRLIVRQGDRLAAENGPLPEERFGQLDGGPWTLLVQAVDHHVPDVAALMEPFRFVPDWRIDDVMVSYASDGGGVGAHFDQYDVFLIQGLGRRRWRVGPVCDAATPLLPDDNLRLIADFAATEEWLLEPGDILYIPPRFAHEGVAVGDDCMTYSVGFRAPSRAELLESWAEERAAALQDEDRYADPDLTRQDHPGEIGPAALDRLHAMVLDALSDRAAFARWFGRYNSLPRYADIDWRPEEPVDADDIAAMLEQGLPLLPNPASRFAFVRQGAAICTLFVDGQDFECPVILAELICGGHAFSVGATLAGLAEVRALIATLIDQGSLAFIEAD